jgi:triosephosphate isomerase (TIM)
MRRPIIAGNWKMFTTVEEALALIDAMREGLEEVTEADKVVCPPFTNLYPVYQALEGSSVGLGAQDLHWEEQGAYTGEISARMIAGLCQFVIIGHSERRQYFGETDEGVNRKINAALANSLMPIVCVGENLQQNEAGETEAWVDGQVRAAFAGLSADQATRVIVAYEPIWAIGTGRAATAAQAQSVISYIRRVLTELYGAEVAELIRIQYGGSTNAGNMDEIMAQPDIDGALVGGASLKPGEFVEMVRIAARVKSAG